jgi:very-short-patch-repair endonuclease
MIDAVCGIALRGNPGVDAAVGCIIEGKSFARRVGPMTNCRAGLFAVELALDVAPGKALRIRHCNTHVGGIGGFKDRGDKLWSPDFEICSRIKRKAERSGSVIEFAYKAKEPRISRANAAAKRCLEAGDPLWTPSELETKEAVESATVASLDGKAESPVETSLLDALKEHFPVAVHYAPYPANPWRQVAALQGELGVLVPQLKIDRYRADIAIVGQHARFVVEVDGYRFHDMDRDQLERDRRRDRWMTAHGWRVVRFTGREVYRNAQLCAREVAYVVSEVSR